MALVAGRSASSLAKQYGIGKDSVQRHRRNCLPDRLAAVQAAQEVEVLSAEALLAEVQRVKARAEELCDLAALGDDIKAQASTLRELRQTVELLAKLSFAAADRPGRNADESRPDIDALILEHVRAEAAPVREMAQLTAPVDDAEVVEAELVD